MSFVLEQSSIEIEFSNNWPHTQIARDNVSFSPQGLDEWVRFSDLNADAKQASLGNNPLFRYRGMVVIQIFTKVNSGAARALELSDYVTGIFRSKKIGDVQFQVPAVTRIGPRDGWYQVNVDCPYYRDEE